MVGPATSRYGIAPAPAGLDLVQELLNTSSVGVEHPTTDLLGDLATATRWADQVRGAEGLPPAPLTRHGLARLRELRDVLRETIHERDGRSAAPTDFHADVRLELDHDGEVHPAGPDLVGRIVLQAYAGQQRGDWPRLKVCALDLCDLAFYDRTKNTSARYHTPRCANFVNLHNSRARRRGGGH